MAESERSHSLASALVIVTPLSTAAARTQFEPRRGGSGGLPYEHYAVAQ